MLRLLGRDRVGGFSFGFVLVLGKSDSILGGLHSGFASWRLLHLL